MLKASICVAMHGGTAQQAEGEPLWLGSKFRQQLAVFDRPASKKGALTPKVPPACRSSC